MGLVSDDHQQEGAQFSHEVTFYQGPEDLGRTVAPFVLDGVERGEPVLVAMVPDRAAALEDALGTAAAAVEWVDMAELGGNPARIIPAWRRFLVENQDLGPFRGVGEPAWPGRRPVELEEAELHEALLNVAFDGGPPWRLLCPYDVKALPPEVVAEVARTHPVVHRPPTGTGGYDGQVFARERFATPLPAAPPDALTIPFEATDLAGIRALVRRLCQSARLDADTGDDLVLATHELAMNSVLHAGGRGVVQVWHTPEAVVVEVADEGLIEDPLVGRDLVDPQSETGRGVWMANQLCDLVQVRSGGFGTQVRLHTWL